MSWNIYLYFLDFIVDQRELFRGLVGNQIADSVPLGFSPLGQASAADRSLMFMRWGLGHKRQCSTGLRGFMAGSG
jgi:hypothetical protein